MANMHKMTYAHQAETVRLFQHFCASNAGVPRNFYLALLTVQTSQGQHLLSIFSSFIVPQAVPLSKRDLRGIFSAVHAKVYPLVTTIVVFFSSSLTDILQSLQELGNRIL